MRKSVLVVLAFAALPACASVHEPQTKGVAPQQQFEMLKSLAGTWNTTPESGMQGSIVYRVVGNGSAVQETIFPGTPHEMVTMYHLDGPKKLMLTHYCAAGNQPVMRAAPSDDLSSIRWEFVRLSNGDPSKDMHMHEGVMTFGPDGHLRPVWTSWEGGKPGGFEARLDLVRAN